MPKLNQINALVTGQKGEAEKFVTGFYHTLQKPELFDGMERTYRPLDEEYGEKLPPESKKVQFKVKDMVEEAANKWTEAWDLVCTQDVGNQSAKSDISVNGTAVLRDVPVTTLLFLEKQINDVETFISKLPTPDQAEDWEYDENQDLLKTRQTQTVRTKKVPRNHVKAEATKEHPAQVDVYMEDIQIGVWNKVRYNGSITTKQKNVILQRVKLLKNAIKVAREQANMIDVAPAKIGKGVFEYLLKS